MEPVLIILLVILLFAVIFLIWQNSVKNQPKIEDKREFDRILDEQKYLQKLLDGKLGDFRQDFEQIRQTVDKKMGEVRQTVDEKIGAMRSTVDEKIEKNTHQTFAHLNETRKQSEQTIKSITEQLARLEETNNKVFDTTKQLEELQNILKNPKQRGVLGEYYLETLLKNVLPPNAYEMQYHFAKDDEGQEVIADAVVFVKDKIVPIDSKFSLENYNRLVEAEKSGSLADKDIYEKNFLNDLKLRIKETAKYIRPAENTMEFAFMFIPHEAIYYDLLVNKIGNDSEGENILQKAAGAYKVIIVSPTSFLAYLQTVLQGLKAMQIEEQAKDIKKRVEELGKHLQQYQEQHQKLAKNLNTAVGAFNESTKVFKRIDKDVVRITGGEKLGLEAETVDKIELD